MPVAVPNTAPGVSVSAGVMPAPTPAKPPEEQRYDRVRSKVHPTVLALINRLKQKDQPQMLNYGGFVREGKAEVQVVVEHEIRRSATETERIGIRGRARLAGFESDRSGVCRSRNSSCSRNWISFVTCHRKYRGRQQKEIRVICGPDLMPTVMKFGGTSVADAHAFENVARIVASQSSAAPVVVVSAMSGVTDALLAATIAAGEGRADEAIASLEKTFQRHHQTAAELLTPETAQSFGRSSRQSRRSNQRAAPSERRQSSSSPSDSGRGPFVWRNALERIARRTSQSTRTESSTRRRAALYRHRRSVHVRVAADAGNVFKAHEVLTPAIEDGRIPVLGGFIASTPEGTTTTLGRGGSDYTAALIGAALTAGEIQIWTDVTGVLTADPRVVPEAQTVERLSYAEASELAYFGAKVLHPKTIQPAIEGSIPVRICNSRAPEQIGTLVGPQTETSDRTIKAIAHKGGVTTVQITSARMLGAYGFLRALFEVFERHRTVVDVVATSEVSVSLSLDDDSALPSIVQELEQLGTVRVEKEVRDRLCGGRRIARDAGNRRARLQRDQQHQRDADLAGRVEYQLHVCDRRGARRTRRSDDCTRSSLAGN